MNTFGGFRVSAIVAAGTVAAIAFVLVPEQSWNIITIITVIAFSLSAGFIFFIPTIISSRRPDTDAAQMASVGPLVVLTAWLLLLMGAAFLLALLHRPEAALAILIFGVGTFFLLLQGLSSCLNLISDISSASSKVSGHVTWRGQLGSLASIATNKESRESMQRIAEQLRYAASDVPGGAPQDEAIYSEINSIESMLLQQADADLSASIVKLNLLIAQRDGFVKSARSKA